MTLLEQLIDLRGNGPHAAALGICHNSPLGYTCRDIFRRWPKYSGNLTFPVPHPEYSPKDAYMKTENMWDRSTEYGRNRWELLDFLIGELS